MGSVPRFVIVRGPVTLVEAFEEAARALPFEDAFREIEIVAQRAKRVGRSTALGLTVDRPGGVDLELCGRIAARLSDALADEPEEYTLEVESAGIDRPLLLPNDYERFRDQTCWSRRAFRLRASTRIAAGSWAYVVTRSCSNSGRASYWSLSRW